MLVKYPPQTLVIVDEIQKLPELLDVDHKLMVENGLYFILSGSSARKIKKAGVNQLGGRANEENLYPLVFAEILNYDNVASDCGVSVNTSKFYFFDVGIPNYLLHLDFGPLGGLSARCFTIHLSDWCVGFVA